MGDQMAGETKKLPALVSKRVAAPGTSSKNG